MWNYVIIVCPFCSMLFSFFFTQRALTLFSLIFISQRALSRCLRFEIVKFNLLFVVFVGFLRLYR